MADLIITERYLKENGLVNDNTDMKVITPIIVLVQDLYIHPILGTDLYNEIQTQINTSTAGTTDAVSSANQTLLDRYVLPCILWYTQCEVSPAMAYRYMNKGIMKKSSENSQPADLTEIKFLMDKWKNNAEVYAQRTTNFLRANTTTYPLYTANTDSDDIQPNKNNYQSSIFLGDEDDCGCGPRYYA